MASGSKFWLFKYVWPRVYIYYTNNLNSLESIASSLVTVFCVSGFTNRVTVFIFFLQTDTALAGLPKRETTPIGTNVYD